MDIGNPDSEQCMMLLTGLHLNMQNGWYQILTPF